MTEILIRLQSSYSLSVSSAEMSYHACTTRFLQVSTFWLWLSEVYIWNINFHIRSLEERAIMVM